MTSHFTEQVTRSTSAFDFVAAHFECESNRFSQENPGGFVNFGSAQNQLHPDLVNERLASVESDGNDAHYQAFAGTSECRTSIANHLTSLSGVEVSHDSVVIGNGVISVLEALAMALLNEGDRVLIPTPVFPGLVTAMSMRVQSKVELMEVGPESDFRLSPSWLEFTLSRLRLEGKRVRAILICSPGNPVGQVFSRQELQEFQSIADAFDCALIVDEVYAGSIYSDDEFVSAISLKSENVYVVSGMSKDFGLAGHATGWLQSTNKDVVAAVAKQAHFFRLPSSVQRIISSFLQPTWRENYLQIHRQKLKQSEHLARRLLRQSGIPIVASEAGLVLWIDLRDFLDTKDENPEMKLYKRLLNQHRIHISPGTGFHCHVAGFFRLCFSQPRESLMEGLGRLIEGLEATPKSYIASRRFVSAVQRRPRSLAKTI